MLRWDEDKIEVNPEDVAYRNEVKDARSISNNGRRGARNY